jgi:probable phosphoglycerate mutase
MTRLILVRHAEARGNVDRVFHGQTDSDITENGEKQLISLAERFKDIFFDVIYSSDLIRAYKTALAVNSTLNLPIIKDEDLREINGGDWEEMPFADLPKKFPEAFYHWDKEPHLLQMPNGESLKAFAQRINNKINKLVKQNKGKTICVVTHGTGIRVFINHILHNALNDINKVDWCDNTGVSLIEFDEHFNSTLILNGDASHLSDELSTIRKQEWWKKLNKGTSK